MKNTTTNETENESFRDFVQRMSFLDDGPCMDVNADYRKCNLRGAIEYCKKKGIKLSDMNEEETRKFGF